MKGDLEALASIIESDLVKDFGRPLQNYSRQCGK